MDLPDTKLPALKKQKLETPPSKSWDLLSPFRNYDTHKVSSAAKFSIKPQQKRSRSVSPVPSKPKIVTFAHQEPAHQQDQASLDTIASSGNQPVISRLAPEEDVEALTPFNTQDFERLKSLLWATADKKVPVPTQYPPKPEVRLASPVDRKDTSQVISTASSASSTAHPSKEEPTAQTTSSPALLDSPVFPKIAI